MFPVFHWLGNQVRFMFDLKLEVRCDIKDNTESLSTDSRIFEVKAYTFQYVRYA